MIVRFEDLGSVREEHKDKKIVFCSGCFDLTHAGHVLFFEECKKLGDVLLVMVARDENVRTVKGENRPILNETIRMKMVHSLKPVDICLFDLPFEKHDPLGNLVKVFQTLQPDIYAVNEDAFDLETRRKMAEACGVTMRVLRFNEYVERLSISTTAIIRKIKGVSDADGRDA